MLLEHLLNLLIIMISEGLCDTEDWSNDAENSGFFLRRNKLSFINVLLYVI